MVGNFTILSCWPDIIIELFVCHFWSGLMVGSVTFGSQCYCAGGHFPLKWLIFSVAKAFEKAFEKTIQALFEKAFSGWNGCSSNPWWMSIAIVVFFS